ncbi:hypothetical protein ES703_123516 [subsurface metagenome]
MEVFIEAKRIIETECAVRGLSPEALSSPLRTRTITNARQQIIKRLRKETDLSWREIAHVVGLKPGGRLLTRKPK